MKKNKYIILMAIIILMLCPLIIHASQINPDNFKPIESTRGARAMYAYVGTIAGVIRIAGTIVSAGALIIIGIKYVVSSVEERAEYKERLFPYVIGAVLLFGASSIVGILYEFSVSSI